MGEVLGIVLGVLVLGTLAGIVAIKRLIIICQPSEVVIVSGPQRLGHQNVGYRHLRGGRRIWIPLLQKIDRMDLTNIGVPVTASGAYSRDGIPLNIQGVANIKLDGDPPGLDNAVERLLGKSPDEVVRIARETLEGNLRGVLARLTPQQVNEDKESFAAELIEEAEVDLRRLGLVLDTLKIQTVADDVGYLDSIGRKKNAELVKRARTAEAERTAEATIRNASNLKETRIAQVEAEISVARAEAQKRIVDAKTQRAAEVAREEGAVASVIARAAAEVNVQTERIEEVRLKLEADLIAPAKAYKAQKEAEAKATVAPIIEGGRATAEGLTALAKIWRQAGPSAREIFLLEKLDDLVGIVVGTVGKVKVDRLTVVDGTSLAGQTASVVEQLRSAGDLDLPKLARQLAAGLSARGGDKGAQGG